MTPMANTIRTMTVVIAGGLLAAPAMAQENLMDIYQRALQNDPAIREAEANYLAQAEVSGAQQHLAGAELQREQSSPVQSEQLAGRRPR
jgi:hypothetical protein